MEPVSAAASVVGLVAFAGQLIQGLAKVNSFVQEMKDSDDRIKDLTRESKLLTQTLTELKSVLVGLEGSSVIKNHAYWDPNASSIRGILEACQNDLDQWEQSYMPKQEGSGAKRMFRLVWNGSLRKARDLQSKFAYHRSQISTSIATINTYLSHMGLEKMESVHGDVKSLTEANLRSNMASPKASTEDSAAMYRSLQAQFSSFAETQSKQQSIHEETLSRFSSVGSSIESLVSVASSLQRLLSAQSFRADGSNDAFGDYLDPNQGRKPRPSVSSARNKGRRWSCRAIIGIDDALVEEHSLGQVHCLFCWQNLSKCGYHAKAKHIIERHNIAGCDQNMEYPLVEDFEEHLAESHGFSSPHFNATNYRFLANPLAQYNSRYVAVFGKPPPIAEKSARQLLLAWEMTSLLSKTPYLLRNSMKDPAGFGQLNKGMELLAGEVFSTTFKASSSELPHVLLQAANLEQEFIVYFNRPFPRRWAPLPECLLTRSSGSQLHALTAKTLVALRPHLHGMMWPLVCPQSRECHICQQNIKSKVAGFPLLHTVHSEVSGLCKLHNDYILQKICPGSAHLWCSLDPTLKITAIFAELRSFVSTKDRINLWMLDVLHKSDHLLTILRCSLFLEPDHPDLPPSITLTNEDNTIVREAEPKFWGRAWTADLLATFERDPGQSADVLFSSASVGAVDSRDEYIGLVNQGHEDGHLIPPVFETRRRRPNSTSMNK